MKDCEDCDDDFCFNNECIKCVKQIQHRVCLTSDYVYKIVEFEDPYRYKILNEEYTSNTILEDNCTTIDIMLNDINYSPKLLKHFKKTYPDKTIVYSIYTNLYKEGFVELYESPLLYDINIFRYCHNDEDLKKNYKKIFDIWFKSNIIFFNKLFKCVKNIISKGVYHKDMFGKNIFVDLHYNVKLIDFEYSDIIHEKLKPYNAFKHFIRNPIMYDKYGAKFLPCIFVHPKDIHYINSSDVDIEELGFYDKNVMDYFIHFMCLNYEKYA